MILKENTTSSMKFFQIILNSTIAKRCQKCKDTV